MIQGKLNEIKRIERLFIEITDSGNKHVADNEFFLDAILNVTAKLRGKLTSVNPGESIDFQPIDKSIQVLNQLYLNLKEFESVYKISTQWP